MSMMDDIMSSGGGALPLDGAGAAFGRTNGDEKSEIGSAKILS